jgi:hypothetical protein
VSMFDVLCQKFSSSAVFSKKSTCPLSVSLTSFSQDGGQRTGIQGRQGLCPWNNWSIRSPKSLSGSSHFELSGAGVGLCWRAGDLVLWSSLLADMAPTYLDSELLNWCNRMSVLMTSSLQLWQWNGIAVICVV